MKIARTVDMEGLEARIKAELMRQNISLVDVAERTGISQSYLSQMLQGQTVVIEDKFRKIEEALGVDFGVTF